MAFVDGHARVGAPRVRRPHRDLPRPGLRLRAVVGVRQGVRPDHLVRRRPPARSPRTSGSTATGCRRADWFGLPARTSDAGGTEIVGWHLPEFKWTFVLLVLPAVIALIAENTGHVKAVAEMTGDDLDPFMGRAIAADGVGTAIASVGRRLADDDLRREHRRHGGDPGLLDRGVLRRRACRDPVRASRPKFGAVVSATPGGVLGGITVVLYGMIGLLGAKIWKENRVDFGNPVNLVPLAAGHHHRDRRHVAEVHRRLHAQRHRARHDRGRSSATTSHALARHLRDSDRGRPASPSSTRRHLRAVPATSEARRHRAGDARR